MMPHDRFPRNSKLAGGGGRIRYRSWYPRVPASRELLEAGKCDSHLSPRGNFTDQIPRIVEMGRVHVTFPDGRTVDGEITNQRKSFLGTPVLIVEGHPYSGLDAINEGLLVYPTDDPLFDSWLNTFAASG
jgi:hypothetical protein